MRSKRLLLAVILTFILVSAASAQKPKFSYLAQKKFIPADLGQVYLGMPFKAFSAKIPLDGAEADIRYDWLEVIVPLKKGGITGIVFRVHGLTPEEKAAIVKKGMIKDKNDLGQPYEREADVIDAAKIPNKGFVYAMYISFKGDYDLKAWTGKTFGKPGDIHKEGDNGYFYDHQWTAKTPDGLTWLVRAYFKEGNSLQLLGRIKDTEWDPNM